jgi:iron(III) transport system ATP-binding protein
LRALAGFERIRSGTISIGSDTVDGSAWIPPERRPVGLVFQDYALFPHMTVRKNIAFGISGDPDEEVARLLELIGLSDRTDAMPAELSGGEQQRVALARALARRPKLLLMDEPFSNLDPDLRADVRRQTFELVRELGISTLLVTHTADEAMAVGDRISVIERGKLLQTGTARQLYQTPATIAVARSLGPANVIVARATDESVSLEFGSLGREVCTGVTGDGFVIVRPEDLAFGDTGQVAIDESESVFLGDRVMRRLRAGGLSLVATCAPWDAENDSARATIRRAHFVKD